MTTTEITGMTVFWLSVGREEQFSVTAGMAAVCWNISRTNLSTALQLLRAQLRGIK